MFVMLFLRLATHSKTDSLCSHWKVWTITFRSVFVAHRNGEPEAVLLPRCGPEQPAWVALLEQGLDHMAPEVPAHCSQSDPVP